MEAIPLNKVYKFKDSRPRFDTLDIDQAEEKMKKYINIGDTWMMKKKKSVEGDDQTEPSKKGEGRPMRIAKSLRVVRREGGIL